MSAEEVSLDAFASWCNVSATTVSSVGDHVLRFFILFGLSFLIWFLLTAIIMLIATKKSAKRGRVILVFVLMSLLYMGLCAWAYFNIDVVLRVFNV